MPSQRLFQLGQRPGHILSIKVESNIIEASGLIFWGLRPILGDHVGDGVASEMAAHTDCEDLEVVIGHGIWFFG
jgi:hypothetical protein